MPECPICRRFHGRSLLQPFHCVGCGVELEIAGSTIALAILLPLLAIALLLLAKPWIGRAGVIVGGLILGHLAPWIAFFFYYRLEPTGASLDIERRRE